MTKALNLSAVLVSLITTLLIMTGEAEARALRIADVLTTSEREGGGAVGNGGGTVVCRDSNQKITQITLLDFYEMRLLRNMDIDANTFPGTFMEKAQALIDRLGKHTQLRQKIYSKWLQDFANESAVLTGVEFNNIPDALQIAIPKGCKFEQAAVQIVPRFPGDKRYYLNGELWQQLDDTQKAGLILHEIVYREALSYGHTDSIATRYFVGLMSSPQIESMSFKYFLETLEQVHFEQTDIPFSTAKLKDVKTEFAPHRLWRMGRQDEHDKIEKLTFIGRVVANIGTCRDLGCTQWDRIDYEGGVNITDNMVICSGTESIYLPGESTAIHITPFAYMGDPSKKCGASVRVQYTDYNHSFTVTAIGPKTDSSSGFAKFIYLSPELLPANGQMLSFQERENKFKLSSFLAETFRRPVNGRFVFEVETLTGLNLTSCLLSFSVERGKLKQVTNVFSRTDSDPTKELRCSNYFEYKMNGMYLKVSLTRGGLIDFDENESYLGDRKVSNIATDGVTNRLAAWSCTTSYENCMEVILQSEKPMVRVSRNMGQVYLNGPVCEVADGAYELHSGSVVPKTITLRNFCMLQNPNGAGVGYETGSILILDVYGRVISKI